MLLIRQPLLNEVVMTKHEEYTEALMEQCEQKIHYIFLDIEDELDNIEQELETEASKILLSWVRDSIRRVSDNYKV
jgi:hypothetical protein